ncbi:hypothetical protein [Azospirillum rugosum]|uniref:Uncharacterized protein n=1 Tax=Azospirillum rugosum TaxID=416170 RepID=A0ABS4SXX0_9PROT|nr:hypothetical protein [Azospirillum rugosum]MBP2296933.1 hypothetical protein [Azospirillum rugosum]MDQ0530692.1 hypothetical protein [Azospirillum rugosum]
MLRTTVLTVLCATALAGTAHAQTPKAQTLKFWNLTTETITELKLAEPNTNKWGKNQTLNDKDKTVEADERLKLSDVTPGVWDVSVKDKKKRSCVLRNVTLSGTDAYAFSISEDEMAKCKGK